jgi:sulfite exporter TauE/SafE
VIDALLLVAGGLLGSAHCVGMCGGFALLLAGNRRGLAANVGRQLVYSLGRIAVYTLGGAAAGYGGWRLRALAGPAVNAQALLCLAAGLLLVGQGLAAAGVLPRLLGAGGASCPGIGSFSALLRARKLGHVFAAGLLNGLLPCGLVYAYLALAGSTGSLPGGAATMALFGLGTVPALVLVGSGGAVLSLALRRRVFRAAAWCVVLTGVLSVARGLSFLHWPGSAEPAGCPVCGPPEPRLTPVKVPSAFW